MTEPISSSGPPDEAPDEAISLADAAEELGVHYMTAYRYVRTGRLAAVKRGGQWRVTREAMAAMLRDATQPSAPCGPREQLLEPFFARLCAGDAGGCWELVTEALRSGASPLEIHQRLIGPALEAVGDGWQRGEISVATEHLATATASRLLGRLGPQFRPPGRRRGTVVVGAVAGDPHALPSAMLGDQLRSRSFEVVDLGANAPAASFLEVAAGLDDLVAIGVCVMLDECIEPAQTLLQLLETELPATMRFVGGAATAGAASRLDDLAVLTGTADDACEAIEEMLAQGATA